MIVSFGPLSMPFQVMKVYVDKIESIKSSKKFVKVIYNFIIKI